MPRGEWGYILSAHKSYLLDRQRDITRLRRLGFEEFVRARNSGQLIACVGSYASKHLGYPDWKGLVEAFIAGCTEGPAHDGVLKGIQALRAKGDARFSDVDLMDMAELLAGRDRHTDPAGFKDARKKFADANFGLLGTVADAADRPSIAKALFRELNIARVVTLNYDLELEWEAFFTDFERQCALLDDRETFWNSHNASERKDYRRVRLVPGFGHASSEVLIREDSAPLIEFALGGPRDGRRIFHLHGRVDAADSLLVTRRDYRDRYWNSGFSKLPFEYGLRLVFSGNPILFVGIGMSEGDVMQGIEQMLSDNPNRRAVPMFLLWSSSTDVDQDNAFRLLFNRKFGVHVLFDREIAEISVEMKAYDAAIAKPVPGAPAAPAMSVAPHVLVSARRLEEPLKLLAELANRQRNETFWYKADFRTPQLKYRGNPARVNVWSPIGTTAELGYQQVGLSASDALSGKAAEDKLIDVLGGNDAVQIMIGEPSSGRGALASAMARAYENHYRDNAERPGRVILINGSFVTETDSIFAILSGAFDGKTAFEEGMSRARATDVMLKEINGIYEDCLTAQAADSAIGEPQCYESECPVPELTVIINGMERFIAHDGSALSTELDSLIRMVTRSNDAWRARVAEAQPGTVQSRASCYPVRLVLIGTPRLLRYLSVVAGELAISEIKRERPEGSGKAEYPTLHIGEHKFSVRCPSYFSRLEARVANVGNPYSFRSSSRRREFLAMVLDSVGNGGDGIDNPNLALEIVRVLAFIGQPTEQHVLLHVPSLWDRIEPGKNRGEAIECAVRQLLDKGLLIEVEGFPTAPCRRIGIHKALIAEIRQRHGVPISDARLASGFNIGQYTAQPVDSFLPDQRWHQDIGKIVDFLIGQHKDPVDPEPVLLKAGLSIAKSVARRRHRTALVVTDYRGEELARIASPVMMDCLRAALSLMRSYYSTSALLMYGNRDLDPIFSDGPLTQHSERLVRLIRAARTAVTVRREMRTLLSRDHTPEQIETLLGPEAYYADDLVWLNNELGVVRTTQGDLFGARAALEEAMRLDARFLDFGERNQNWRRISLNLVQVDIDTGNIEDAEERLRDIESAIENEARQSLAMPARLVGGYLSAPFTRILDYIVAVYAHGDCSAVVGRTDRTCPTDVIVATALVLGYRGLCFHLRGAFEAANEHLRDATAILERINEHRAYAFFQRHRASLLAAMDKAEAAKASLGLCLAAAGPSRQTDIDHSGRIAMVKYGIDARTAIDPESHAEIIPQLIETLRYATASDMYRLQVEAMQSMASAHFRNGDTDSAMNFATDAMAVASRNGFELRKVSLRILLGRIMALRGDRKAARQLLLSASEIGAKLHYYTAVEKAEDALVMLN